jgi:hypothetical protein
VRTDRRLGADVARLADALELLGEPAAAGVAAAARAAAGPALDAVEVAIAEERIR